MRPVGIWLAVGLLTACGPAPSDPSSGAKAKPPMPKAHRKCPDPNLRDIKDPCSPMYVTPYKSRFKRDRF